MFQRIGTAHLARTQTSTTRKGIRKLPLGPAMLESGKQQIAVEITAIKPIRFDQLSEDDAKSGGLTSLADLQKSLKAYNPDLIDSSYVTVIHFHLVP